MRVPLAASSLRESDIKLVIQVLCSGNLTMGSQEKIMTDSFNFNESI